MSNKLSVVLIAGVAFLVTLGAPGECQSRRHSKDKDKDPAAISVLDSTEAQWGMRSVNDSLYRGYPLNAVYLERSRTRLPESFPHYKQGKLGSEIIVSSPKDNSPPTTIRVNGVDTPIGKPDSHQ